MPARNGTDTGVGKGGAKLTQLQLEAQQATRKLLRIGGQLVFQNRHCEILQEELQKLGYTQDQLDALRAQCVEDCREVV